MSKAVDVFGDVVETIVGVLLAALLAPVLIVLAVSRWRRRRRLQADPRASLPGGRAATR